ncbi:MAG TPA: hypothetical protein VMF50_02335 [Candidatus Binataceae bacterium]|nr:hypothetical protein [Candidatus Binataceae bacterium]
MMETPRFLQGLYYFEGRGLDKPLPLAPAAGYSVPFDKRAQLIYFRAGNPAEDLIYLVLTRNGKAMRYFPIGAKAAIHVPLAVVEDLNPEDKMEMLIAAPAGLKSPVVVDVGFVEI